jgi:hypothetical protein
MSVAPVGWLMSFSPKVGLGAGDGLGVGPGGTLGLGELPGPRLQAAINPTRARGSKVVSLRMAF